MEVFSDSDHAGDLDERRSTTGIVIKIRGITVLAKSRKQRLTAKSSTQAEIIAMSDAVEESIWVKNLLLELDQKQTMVTLQADNQPGISTVQNAKISKGNKHIAVRYYFIKDYVKQKELEIKYVPTKENVADIMTKALTKKTFAIYAINETNRNNEQPR